MKKFGLFLVGVIAFFVLLANIGPLLGLAVSLVVTYYAVKEFIKTDSTGTKILWGIIAFIAIAFSIANVPAVLAVVAAYILYVVYKNWNKEKENNTIIEAGDPFTNFEKQWNSLNK
ncbi:flagellar basal body rod protein [Sutcliffiella horikoshii]|uniref:Flagellar basal body rod protein n=1 Tax=Sutcliffiella horikoshii TaxID=79883 RepID=A0A5D4SWW0_9BACI|nr:flagellar basal body rod protein [Sutcliffiella horikoshii]TYS67161.1 flagellar basal body rod protein [Sutcliffiella horikoshii]